MQGSPSWFLSDTQSDMRTHRAPDSHDSYAATLLWAIHQYVSATGDIAWLMHDSVHQGYSNAQVLKEVLYTNLLTQFDAGLTKTFQQDISPQGVSYPVRFLMDNCEVWAGLNAAVQIFKLLGHYQFADYVDSFRQASQQGIETLWQPEAGAYRWALGQDMTKSVESFYPTINSQYWPALWGVPLSSNNLSAAMHFADDHYQFWWRRQDIDDFANLGAHYALVEKLGRTDKLEAILQTVRQRSFRQAYSNALPPSELLISDAAYYLSLQMRQEANAPYSHPRSLYPNALITP
jgi:hypothetical protein